MGVDPSTAAGSVLAALGLSGAAGLNAWLPLLAAAALDRAGAIELAAPFGALSSTPALIALAVMLAADFVGDKVPAVDHAVHAIGTVVHPAAGALLFTGQAGAETDLPAVVTAVAGALVAGSVHGARAAVRPVSTTGTLGVGNPVLSAVEDAASAVLTALAFLLPVVAAAAVVAAGAGLVAVARRLRRSVPRVPT